MTLVNGVFEQCEEHLALQIFALPTRTVVQNIFIFDSLMEILRLAGNMPGIVILMHTARVASKPWIPSVETVLNLVPPLLEPEHFPEDTVTENIRLLTAGKTLVLQRLFSYLPTGKQVAQTATESWYNGSRICQSRARLSPWMTKLRLSFSLLPLELMGI